jgi:uncharacterized protein
MSTRSWTDWGPLAERYRETRPRRMLALDGGGIRGLLTLQILDRLEQELRRRQNAGPEFRLCRFFDLIGGTSTGAIIAAGLARGMSTAELMTFYREFGREAFTKRALIARWKSLYANGPLQRKLQNTFGHKTTLEPQHLRSLLVVVTRNATTDSAWPIFSNPWAKYNDRARPDCNLLLPLWQIVRASTAAPVYFQPEVVALDENDPNKTFVFVDGGTTAYNNPAFLIYRMVTEPAYQLGWAKGEHDLLMVSVGTGSAPTLGQTEENPEQNLAGAAIQALSALMSQAAFDQDLSCRTIGRCVAGPVLDREVGDLIATDAAGQRLPLSTDLGRGFLYARYDADLTPQGLTALGCGDLDAATVSKLDSIDHMDDLERVGRAVANEISVDDFGPFLST